jgi:hypothetical protein
MQDRTRRARFSFLSHPAALGVLLIAAGWIVWAMLSEKKASVPEMWQQVRVRDSVSDDLQAAVRAGGPGQGSLLRLEWEAHPAAASYLIEFEGGDGFRTSPIPSMGNVFLYDLKSNVFGLPQRFRWTVTAVMPDGTQIAGASSSFQHEEIIDSGISGSPTTQSSAPR